MPRAKAIPSLSGMIDADMEDNDVNADAFPTPESNQENTAPGKKKAGRPKATAKKFTRTRRVSGGSVSSKPTTAPKRKAGKRTPLKEQAHNQQGDDTEEVDEFGEQANNENVVDEQAETKQPAKRKGRAKASGKHAKTEPENPANSVHKDGEFEYTPTAVRQTKGRKKAMTRKGGDSNHQAPTEPLQLERVIQETQVPMDVDTLDVHGEDDDEAAVLPQSVFRRTTNARDSSHQRQPPIARRRAGSASDTERTAGDPALRKRLGEMTRKFENLDSKYRNLRDTGIKEAEANFEKLKAQSGAKAKVAHDLIVSLKKELATQKALAQQSRSMEKQISSRNVDLAKTQTLADELSASLSEAQNENKALQAKLAHSRSASVAVESLGSKTPGSAMKGRNQAQTRTIMVGSAEAAHAAQVAQLKEDLYSDLTGLILRGIERTTESDVYDCIQTGRNGTLHFKLAIAKETEDSYENTEFQYTPRLDSNRDRDLIAMLPEYLTDEITFARTNASAFYGKIVETLTKKRVVEEQE